MVRNRCTDTLRSRSRGSNRDGTAEQQCPERSEPASAQGDLLAREEALRLERLLRHVPDAEAEVIRLRVWSELTFADIAAAVQSSVPTVKSRFRYGVDKLRRLLAEEDDPQRGHRR
jgi:RNA polymerase sigma-70 factor (ECF subfamily)